MNHDFQRNRKKYIYMYLYLSMHLSKYLSVYTLELAQLMGAG